MNDRTPTQTDPDEERPDYRRALRAGLTRAALHLVRAGYEVVAGVGALLDELVRERSGAAEGTDDAPPLRGPQRIELD